MKVNRPLFSIATPCWNSVSTIERTLKSVLIQDFKDYEYIIVDGGSTDGTLEILKKYESLFEGRMTWVSEPDKGLYDAFNKGIARSNGIYCWNVNADDYIDAHALSNLAKFIQSNKYEDNCPVISGVLNFVSRDGVNIYSQFKSNSQYMVECFKKDHIGVPHPATIVPKMIYEKYGVYDIYYKICGDVDWFHRVYTAGVNFVFVDFILINMADGGVSNAYNYRKSLRDRKYYLKKYYTNFFERNCRLLFWTLSFFKQKIEHFLSK